MNNRCEVLAHIDKALEQLEPLDNHAALEALLHRLNELLKPTDDLYDPPWVAFHSISAGHTGLLTAIAGPLHIQEDIFGWCRNVEAYLGGRPLVEPKEAMDVRSLMAMSDPGG